MGFPYRPIPSKLLRVLQSRKSCIKRHIPTMQRQWIRPWLYSNSKQYSHEYKRIVNTSAELISSYFQKVEPLFIKNTSIIAVVLDIKYQWQQSIHLQQSIHPWLYSNSEQYTYTYKIIVSTSVRLTDSYFQ